MPADVSFEHVSPPRAPAAVSGPGVGVRRLPLAVGLTVAACASGGLWFAAVAGIRALLF